VGTAARLRYGILASKGLTSNLDSTSPGIARDLDEESGELIDFGDKTPNWVSPGKVLVARVFGSAERVENQDDSFVRELGRFVDFAAGIS